MAYYNLQINKITKMTLFFTFAKSADVAKLLLLNKHQLTCVTASHVEYGGAPHNRNPNSTLVLT